MTKEEIQDAIEHIAIGGATDGCNTDFIERSASELAEKLDKLLHKRNVSECYKLDAFTYEHLPAQKKKIISDFHEKELDKDFVAMGIGRKPTMIEYSDNLKSAMEHVLFVREMTSYIMLNITKLENL